MAKCSPGEPEGGALGLQGCPGGFLRTKPICGGRCLPSSPLQDSTAATTGTRHWIPHTGATTCLWMSTRGTCPPDERPGSQPAGPGPACRSCATHTHTQPGPTLTRQPGLGFQQLVQQVLQQACSRHAEQDGGDGRQQPLAHIAASRKVEAETSRDHVPGHGDLPLPQCGGPPTLRPCLAHFLFGKYQARLPVSHLEAPWGPHNETLVSTCTPGLAQPHRPLTRRRGSEGPTRIPAGPCPWPQPPGHQQRDSQRGPHAVPTSQHPQAASAAGQQQGQGLPDSRGDAPPAWGPTQAAPPSDTHPRA